LPDAHHPTATPAAPHQVTAPPAGTAAAEASGLVRRFGDRRAVDGVTLRLAAGDCLALFGPNGAGKTTLLRMLGGLLRPSAGTVRVGGAELGRDAGARARVGVLSHQSMLYAPLTARENVEFSARLYDLPRPREAAERALARMRVLERAETPVRALSRGLQQRVSVARATVHEPRLLLLDEPYTGLDDAGAAALTELLVTLKAAGTALVLVTHNLHEGLALATHVAVMRGGRFVREAARAEIDGDRFVADYRAGADA
jgi:heme exporter protein A